MANQDLSLPIIAGRLAQSVIFKNLAAADLLAIAEFCHEETFQDGDVVLVEGESAEKLFVVARGKLALEKKVQLGRHSTPRNATIDYVGPGDMAGFSSLASPHVYATSVVCVEPTRGICVDGIKLREYLANHPAAGYQVMSVVAELCGSRYRHAIDTLTYFLSVVSHELRAPLAAIENYLQGMLGGYAGELTPKMERMVRRSVLRVTDLRIQIGDVVDLARMRPEQIRTDFEWFDPGEVCAESVEDVRLAASEKNITLKLEPPPEFLPMVGARRRMRQAVTNLLTNAIRYSPPGSTVTFRARYEPERFIVEVADEGPGIPPEDMPQIFQDFFRASNIEDTTGMGLGLSITKKIVDAHQGKIIAENLPGGVGARFTIIVPRNLMTREMRYREWSGEEGL